MDNDRPELDIKHFGDVCPDKNGVSKRKCNIMNSNLPMTFFKSP
jgi:hypothetical protein